MVKKTARVPLLAVVSLFSFAVAFSSFPSIPTVRDIAWRQASDLQAFLGSVNHPYSPDLPPQEFHLVEEDTFSSVLTEEQRSFELFGPMEKRAGNAALPMGVPFRAAIERTAERYDLDSRLLAAVVEAESNFNPRVVSPKGAVGLTQVMPTTAPQSRAGGPADLHDPDVNLDAGARYLRLLLDQFEGNTELALAAYNAGPGNVARFRGVPPFSETRVYVQKVMRLYERHQSAEHAVAEEPTPAPASTAP